MGVIEALDERDCLVSRVRDQIAFVLEQPGGHCPECRQPLTEINDLLSSITSGTGTMETIGELEKACQRLQRTGACHLGREAVNPILTVAPLLPGRIRAPRPAQVLRRAWSAPNSCWPPATWPVPAGIDIPSFLALIAEGMHQEAWEVMREDNPFPWVCGLVCPHPCETTCVRANLDEPINIRYLKAFASEWVANHGKFTPPACAPAQRRQGGGHRLGPRGPHLCLFSGPARATRSRFSRPMQKPGGLLRAAIPDYRLPRDTVDREISLLKDMGVEVSHRRHRGPGRHPG